MKKMIALILSTVTFFLVFVSAQGKTLTSLSEVDSKDLSVTVLYPSTGSSAPVKDGSAQGVLPDGSDYSASKLPNTARTLFLHLIEKTETEPYNWVRSCVGEKTEIFKAYFLTARDGEGKPVSHDGASVTMDLPDSNDRKSIILCYLDTEGNVRTETLSVTDGTVTFTADHSSYYVFCTSYDNPGTSDVQRAVYLTLISASVLSAITLGILWFRRRRTA